MRIFMGRRLGPLWLGVSRGMFSRLPLPAVPPQHRAAYMAGFAIGTVLTLGALALLIWAGLRR